MNGSFVIPARYVKKIQYEKIWLYHSIIGLVLIPWLLLFVFYNDSFHQYSNLGVAKFILLMVGGFAFGVGQICFAFSIESIGIALAFAVNLGLGVVIGSLCVAVYRSDLYTHQGMLVLLSIVCILFGLICYYAVGRKSSNSQNNLNHMMRYHLGWVLAIIAGITSGLQNITFVIIAFGSAHHAAVRSVFWVWPPFLLAAAIPMIMGFACKAKSAYASPFASGRSNLKLWHLLPISIMGLFFTGSLALYGTGMACLSQAEHMIGWPLFMVLMSVYWV